MPAIGERKLWFENIARDIRHTGRRLRRDPAFVLLASLILALSVGANAAVFAVLETLLFQPLPVPHPEQLIRITSSLSGEDAPLSGPIFDALRQRGRAIAEITAWAPYQTFLQDRDRSERVEGALASGNSFSVLHLRPQVGRLLKPTDDVLGGSEGAFAAVISDSFWKRRYGGSLTVLNRQMTINGIPVVIVGVLPPKFHGMLIGSSVDVVLPLEFEVAASGPLSHPHFAGSTWLMVFGRRNSGVSLAAATIQLRVLSPAILREGLATLPASTQNEFLPRLTLAIYDGKTGGAGQAGSSGGNLREVYKNPLLAVQALSLFLLLLCIANLTALQFSRSKAREREFAISESLGAPRSRIWSQLLIESALIGIVGGVAALAVSYALDSALGRLLADQMEEWLPARVPNSIVIVSAVGFAIGSMALCNVVIGLSLKRANLAEVLSRSNFRTLTYTKSGILNWQILIPLQISVCMILLVAAGLFLGTLSKLLTSPMGFDPNGVVLFPFSAGHNRIPPAKQKAMEIRILDRLRAAPGVSSAALLDIAPIGGGHATTTVKSTGKLSIVDPQCAINAIGPGYLEVMRTQLLQGREFQPTDTAKSIPVCMLTRSAAKYFFPNLSALGKRANHATASVAVTSRRMSSRRHCSGFQVP